MTFNVFKVFSILFLKRDIQNNYFVNAIYAHVENTVSAPGRAAQLCLLISVQAGTLLIGKVIFEIFETKPCSLSYSALAAILPVLPCEFLEQWGKQEGENEILLLFLKCVCLLRCHYTTHLDNSASVTTAFIFSLTVIGAREYQTVHSGNLIYTKKICVAGVL